MLRTVRAILPVLVLGFEAARASTTPVPDSLILAVHPYLPPAEIIQRFTPLAGVFARAVGRPVAVRVGRTYAEHIEAIGTDSVEIAYMGPVPYLLLVSRYGAKPLLARQEVDGEPYLRGEIIVRRDSPFKTLRDLKGKRFAFGDVDSTMSHVVPLRMLERAGVPERSLGAHDFLGAHKNVALAVLAGDYDAGAVKDEVFKEFAPKGLRSLAAMPPVADHLLVASTKLPAAMVDRLRRALLGLKETAEGRAVMTSIHPNMTAMVPAKDSDYDSLRRIMANPAQLGRRRP